MNLKDFYSQEQAMLVLGMTPHFRTQIIRWRDKKHKCLGRKPYWIDLCNKPFYLRKDVDDYMLHLCRIGKKRRKRLKEKTRKRDQRYYFEIRRNQQIRWNIDLDEWWPHCKAIEHISPQILCILTNNLIPLIDVKQVKIKNHFFNFYKREDVEKYSNS